MCKAIQDMMAESEAKGRVKTLIELVRSGDLTIEKAAEKLGVSEEEFRKLMD